MVGLAFMVNDADELVVIGKITAVYGVKGWVKIHSLTEPMENFVSYQGYYLERADQWEAVEFDQIKRHSKGLVGLVEGVTNRDQAKRYCQCNIAVPASEMAKLDDGQFYWYQLEGLQVWTAEPEGNKGSLLGTLDHMMETGANDVLVVKASKESIDKRERLIPYLPDQVIKNIDIDAGFITVDWDPEF